MIIPTPTFPPLQKSLNEEHYNLYLAALEWNLLDPIVIKDTEDIHSKNSWKDKVEPYHHQVKNLLTFCRRLPVTLLSDDVGLGKTISAGLIVSELMERNYVSKILIVCPKLLMPQWKEELEFKFGIDSVEAIGRELLTAEPSGEKGAVITTYHSARLYLSEIANSGFQMLILDEAHKLRNLYGTQDAPQVAISFQKALANRLFKYVLMLTATPIQNRLWDIYSLVDLLTVARGHENPFGSEGMFVRNFIADSRSEARELKPEKKDEFRSIVYSYMSRTRRNDAMLQFPTREVQLHRVNPTKEEYELLDVIKEPIQKFNKLMQISILQALVSSPHALAAQLETSARNGTVPQSLALEVRSIVNRMKITAKLEGLYYLIKHLQAEQGNKFRMVIFTERRETQTTIEAFLGGNKISCGLINGDSGAKNQQTISKFKKNPPDVQVIISTRAGSEGVNLQAANILVNYDLPWNPMIVEQRIGRVQRLNSEFDKVCIFNIVLQGTFEEYIVGRLMEKLQMASHAIGDIEALLEATGIDDDDSTKSFEEKIRELVVSSLAGNDVELQTKLEEESIDKAKIELEREEENINDMLGGTEGSIDLSPRPPNFPIIERSMTEREFSLKALENIGATLTEQSNNKYSITLDGQKNLIRFDDLHKGSDSILCKSGSPFFEKMVSRFISIPKHFVIDVDENLKFKAEEITKEWLQKFMGIYESISVTKVRRCFAGFATLRVRLTVTHDSYERLLTVECSSKGDFFNNLDFMQPLGRTLEDLMTLGLPINFLQTKVMEDIGVSEFCRFYSERLIEERKAAGNDPIKLQKIENDFTPRIEILTVGLKGKMFRELCVNVSYKISDNSYENSLVMCTSTNQLVESPRMKLCEYTEAYVPSTCLKKCEISKKTVLMHFLNSSEISGRLALPEYMSICALTRKKVLSDEVDKSDVTGKKIISSILKTSALSGKKAEPEFFEICEFTKSEVLKNELSVSQFSGKKYRVDEELRSSVSGKTGHKLEFIYCSETQKPITPIEGERCENTNKIVSPGILELCEVSGKRVLPSELCKCSVSGKKALKKYFVISSISNALLLEQEGIKSSKGKFCLPLESKLCTWSGQNSHPEDVQNCSLTGLLFRNEFIDASSNYFNILYSLLEGKQRKVGHVDLWDSIIKTVSQITDNKNLKIAALETSLNEQHAAVIVEVKNWMGLKTRYGGLIYSIKDKKIIGPFVLGKRKDNKWLPDN